MIENLAKALPLGVYLVVKEHRGNQGYRKPRDYRDIWYLPNVMLVPPEYPINELIKGGLGVITMTSRMGWEACVMGKKVIGLGKTFYSVLDEVRKPASWEELRKLLLVADDWNNAQPQQREGRLEALAAAYMSLTCEGKYVFKGGGVGSNENIRLLSEAIVSECTKVDAQL
jgi:capsule polysaccharide export protein KpsC/LpsZ